MVGEDRDAHAGVGVDLQSLDGEGRGERGAQVAGQGERLLGAGVDQHRVLVAAQAREQVASAEAVAQARADLAEQHVAGVVTERVVELLEAVEVDHDQRGGLVAATGQALTERVEEAAAVGQPGDVIGARLAVRVRKPQVLPERQRTANDHRAERADREVLGQRLVGVADAPAQQRDGGQREEQRRRHERQPLQARGRPRVLPLPGGGGNEQDGDDEAGVEQRRVAPRVDGDLMDVVGVPQAVEGEARDQEEPAAPRAPARDDQDADDE